MRPDEMHAQYLGCHLGVRDDLAEPFVFTADYGLGDGLERRLARRDWGAFAPRSPPRNGPREGFEPPTL
jgi:hypothetical protein